MSQFNVNVPFTTKEYMIHSGHEDQVLNQVAVKQAADALRAQGFTKKYHRRAYRWSRNWADVTGGDLEFAKL